MVNFTDSILAYCYSNGVLARPFQDFVTSNLGLGPDILTWNLAIPQPTSNQLAAVTSGQVTAYYTAYNSTQAQSQLADTTSANGRMLQAIMGGANLNPTNVSNYVVGVTPKSMYSIATSIFGLSSSQKTNLISNLFGGNPALYQKDVGPNAAAISAVYASITNASGVASFNQAQQLIIAAMYTQDNPNYLVNPTFDPTINVSGAV